MHLQQGQANPITLTLTEKCTLDAPVFLFHLLHRQTGNEYTFIAQDITLYPNRYNEFSIVEKAGANNLNSEVTLPYTGQYYYAVYEQESTTNLDIEQATTIVETGICIVLGEASEETVYEATETKAVYNG